MCSATSARSPAPRSSSSSERKCTWKRTSPSSSRSLASSPRWAASASSYASSTVCGTIERSSCSRSHGHSTRRRRVSASRRSRAAATSLGSGGDTRPRLASAPLAVRRRPARVGRRRVLRRRRGGRRRVGLLLRRVLAVLDHEAALALRAVLPLVLEVLDELVERLLLLLRGEQALDRRLGLRERLLLL